MLIVGFPLAYLEMALGQYTSTGILLVFDRMTPGFVGRSTKVLYMSSNFNWLSSSNAVLRDELQTRAPPPIQNRLLLNPCSRE